MVNKMKDYLPEIEMDKMKTLLDVEERYETGKITLEEAREIMRTKVGKIRPYHIAYMEPTIRLHIIIKRMMRCANCCSLRRTWCNIPS